MYRRQISQIVRILRPRFYGAAQPDPPCLLRKSAAGTPIRPDSSLRPYGGAYECSLRQSPPPSLSLSLSLSRARSPLSRRVHEWPSGDMLEKYFQFHSDRLRNGRRPPRPDYVTNIPEGRNFSQISRVQWVRRHDVALRFDRHDLVSSWISDLRLMRSTTALDIPDRPRSFPVIASAVNGTIKRAYEKS